MKRISVLLLLAVLFLTGCAKSVESTTPDQPSSPDQAATQDESLRQVTEPKAEPAAQPAASEPEPLTAETVNKAEALSLSKYNRILNNRDIPERAELDAAEIYQYPELPSGCEAVALTIALDCLGYKLEKTDIADKYMEYGDSFVYTYCGDPYREFGAGIYPPGLVTTAQNFINDTGAKIYPVDTTGLTIDELYSFIDAGYPVVVWTTVYMNYPYFDGGESYNGIFYPWYDLEHCVCMYGYDKEYDEVMISDPQRGKISVSATEFSKIYDEIGRFSMVLIDTKDIQGE